MYVWTDDHPIRPQPAHARRRLCAIGLCLLLALGLMAPALAEEDIGPMVMSNFRHPMFPTPDVLLCAKVEDSHFAGAVLVGDSVSEGLDINQVIPELEVMAVIGISPRTAATDKLFTLNRQPCTLAEKLVDMQPTAVYLWLGSNGVDTKPASMVIDDYDRLLNTILSAIPDTPVFLIELTPVKLVAQDKYRNLTNERVDAFNAGLREVAQRHNVYLLPINALLKNDKGLLAAEYGAGDGIHLRGAAYEVIAHYLYTHTIPLEVNGR